MRQYHPFQKIYTTSINLQTPGVIERYSLHHELNVGKCKCYHLPIGVKIKILKKLCAFRRHFGNKMICKKILDIELI